MIVYLERQSTGVVGWYVSDGQRRESPPLSTALAAVRWLLRATGLTRKQLHVVRQS